MDTNGVNRRCPPILWQSWTQSFFSAMQFTLGQSWSMIMVVLSPVCIQRFFSVVFYPWSCHVHQFCSESRLVLEIIPGTRTETSKCYPVKKGERQSLTLKRYTLPFSAKGSQDLSINTNMITSSQNSLGFLFVSIVKNRVSWLHPLRD
jgi:hypothetical protein